MSLRVTKRVNKFCFGAIYNGRLWEKELGVSAQMHTCIFKTGAYICWIFKRDIIVYEYLLIRPGQIKNISKLSCCGLVVST